MFYDDLLGLKYEGDVKILAYSDDLALVIARKDVDELRSVAASSIRKVTKWFESRKLKLAQEQKRLWS